MLHFDHLACSASDLNDGVTTAEAALGQSFAAGGKHPLMATHNRLLGLGDLYLEVIAADPTVPPPARARWFDLDRFSGGLTLTNWVARCDNLEEALAHCPPGMGDPLQLERGAYRWRMAVPQDGRLPFDGCFPALIEWQGAAHPVQALPESGLRLRQFTILHPEAAALRECLAPLLTDARIVIETGPEKRLSAEFVGPQGARWLP